jgi:hypothetical protein
VIGPNPSLITLSGSKIAFAPSNALSDIGKYSITVKAQINGQTTWSETTTANYTYVYPCATATMPISVTCPAPITVNVGESKKTAAFALFLDSATTAVDNGNIICAQTVNYYVASAPSSTANSTMH